jgi:hypothetical protein
MRSNLAPAALAAHGLTHVIVGEPSTGGYHVDISGADGSTVGTVHALMYDVADTAAAAWPETGDVPALGVCPHCPAGSGRWSATAVVRSEKTLIDLRRSVRVTAALT